MAKETVLERLKFAAGERVRDADLMLLADVVRHVAAVAKVPLKTTAAAVLDALEKDGAGLFGLRPGDWPIELSADGPSARIPTALQPQQGPRVLSYGQYSQGVSLRSGYRDGSSIDSLPAGRVGWLALFRLLWVSATPQERGDGHLDVHAGGCVAITREDAARLFGVGAAPLTVVAIQPPAGDGTDSGIVQPVGASWPLGKDAKWTDAIRDAMFKMRHLHAKTDAAIGGVIGRSHSVVSQQIGSKASWRWKDDAWRRGIKWRPSDALLSDCNLLKPQQPLQVLASTLQALGCKPA